MAMPFKEITKSEFKDNYNVVKILNDKLSIMKQLETFNPNNEAVAFGIKKKPRDTMPSWFKQWSENVYEKKQPTWFKEWSENVYKVDIDSIKSRLDIIEEKLIRNNIN